MKREKSNSFPRVPQVVRPEGAEAPSPGQRPGCNTSKAKRPVRAKALIMNAFALTGRVIIIFVYLQANDKAERSH